MRDDPLPTRNLDALAAGLPDRLRARRLSAGLSRTELAAASGVSYKSVCDIEKGRRARVQEKTVILLADGLGCDVGELVDLPDVPDPVTAPSATASSAATAAGPARASRRSRRLVLAGSAALAMLVALLAAAWFAVDRAAWEVHEGDLVVRDALLGRELWRVDELPDVHRVLELPADGSLVVGFMGAASDGAQAWRVARRTGRVLARFTVDEAPIRAAFGDEILSEGQDFACGDLATMDLDGDGRREIVIRHGHLKYYPTILAAYDPDGTVRGQYASRGHVGTLHVADLDGDGRDELLAFGTNNDPAYQGATVIWLEEGAWSGATVDVAGPGRGPVGEIADGARYRLVLPSWGEAVMTRVRTARLHASSPTVYRLDDGALRISFTALSKAGGVSVTCDGRLRPLLATATDVLLADVASWDRPLPGDPDPFPSPAWLEDWLAGARWSELGRDAVVIGPVARSGPGGSGARAD
ncbi:helix-turn-helix domain-containing protein [bacterium]|nr:helix-turn-helix domain-containing protein [bacterium]